MPLWARWARDCQVKMSAVRLEGPSGSMFQLKLLAEVGPSARSHPKPHLSCMYHPETLVSDRTRQKRSSLPGSFKCCNAGMRGRCDIEIHDMKEQRLRFCLQSFNMCHCIILWGDSVLSDNSNFALWSVRLDTSLTLRVLDFRSPIEKVLFVLNCPHGLRLVARRFANLTLKVAAVRVR
jgi:hypothetical protein